jgi:hypothetical protein
MPSFFMIESRDHALKIIRRASNYFIWTSAALILLQLPDMYDRWSRIPAKNGSIIIENIAYFVGFFAGGLVRACWVYLLILVNGLILRRYRSRVSAILFIVLGIYGAGLGLFLLLEIARDSPLHSVQGLLIGVSIFLAIFFASYVWFAGRSLAAAIKLHGEFKDDLSRIQYRETFGSNSSQKRDL